MSINRRDFIITGTAGLVGAIGTKTAIGQNRFAIREATIAELSEQMKSGKLTSEKLVNFYLQEITTVDKKINSIIEINPDAITMARQMDRERRDGKIRGPLHGVPVVVKDNIDTADKMKTTAGSLALLNAPTPENDAFIISQMRAAGAVILGKTNLSEWANFRSTKSSSGWSGRGGQTRNPYILDRSPCGSSAGTGAAISANLAAFGIGTETDGSIVCPSSMCGLVGIKPTVGLVSRSGIIPIAHSQDTAGPMTRNVADAALVLSVICGADAKDEVTRDVKQDYLAALQKDGLKGARVGVARDYFGKDKGVDQLMNTSLNLMRKSGAALIDVKFKNLEEIGANEFEVLLFEFKTDLEKYLVERKAKITTFAELMKFNNDNAAREMPHFGQELLEMSAAKGPLSSKEYMEAVGKSKRLSQAEGIDAVMNEHNLDAIVGPTNAPTWPVDLINGDCGGNYIATSTLPAVAGYPHITVPAGFIKELPIGISFFGRAFSENVLIKFAYAFEQMANARRPPKYLTSAS